jgi:5-methylcytosine-specific restriction enzyme A
MPITPRSDRNKEPNSRVQRTSSDGSIYRLNRWRNVSKMFRMENPLCEVSGQAQDLVINPCEMTDHIIPIEKGGAEWDQRNYMALSNKVHNVKRALESRGFVIASKQGEGGLIPVNRQDIIDKLINTMKKVKINPDGSRS